MSLPKIDALALNYTLYYFWMVERTKRGGREKKGFEERVMQDNFYKKEQHRKITICK